MEQIIHVSNDGTHPSNLCCNKRGWRACEHTLQNRHKEGQRAGKNMAPCPPGSRETETKSQEVSTMHHGNTGHGNAMRSEGPTCRPGDGSTGSRTATHPATGRGRQTPQSLPHGDSRTSAQGAYLS